MMDRQTEIYNSRAPLMTEKKTFLSMIKIDNIHKSPNQNELQNSDQIDVDADNFPTQHLITMSKSSSLMLHMFYLQG